MSNLPASIKDIFEELQNEITWLHGRWMIYRQLFGHSPKRIDLLNKCASVCFGIIQNVLKDEVQLSLCKLTDPARTGKQENLSLKTLQEHVEKLGDQILIASSSNLINEIYRKCESFRIHRHKRLAHFDFTTAMKGDFSLLPPTSRQMINEVLTLIQKYMNTIEIHYCKHETHYEPFLDHDGDELVAFLKYGVLFEELSDEQNVSGEGLDKSQWNDA